jgi:DNA-binding protein H-NS
LTQANEANEKEALEEMIEKMEQALQALEDQDRQINFKIQQLMSQYNQAEQTTSNVLKKQDDAQSNAIRKIN